MPGDWAIMSLLKASEVDSRSMEGTEEEPGDIDSAVVYVFWRYLITFDIYDWSRLCIVSSGSSRKAETPPKQR